MSVLPVGFGSQGGGYTIENSLRFRSSASAYLNRTPTTAGNTRTWTWSGWVKRGGLEGYHVLWASGTNASNNSLLRFDNTYNLRFAINNGTDGNVTTNAIFRDASAWYHIVCALDTTDPTASDRVKIYVNGVRQTLTGTTITLNVQPLWNALVNNAIGVASTGTPALWFDGYLAEINFIDGQALTPSDFGNYNKDTGVWQPAKYTGTYGTNGFYLPFSDNTNTTTLAEDASGNGNDWTPNNISLTAGVTYDSMTDTPTIYADGGNYAVLNPLKSYGGLSQANLSQYNAVLNWTTSTSTFYVSSGKWYWETLYTNITGSSYSMTGIVDNSFAQQTLGNYPGITSTSYGYFSRDATKYNNGSAALYGATYTNNDVIGVALDMDAGTITFYKNGVSQGVAFTGLSGTFTPAVSTYGSVGHANFGQRPFAYTPPTGFLPLHTGNLPDSTIVSGDDYFKTYLYTGNGGGLQVGEIQKPFTTYEVSNSLRFRSSASAYLNKTFGSSDTSKTTVTMSAWVKRGKLGAWSPIFGSTNGSNAFVVIGFDTNDKLVFRNRNSSSIDVTRIESNAVYRDPSAWYHVVAIWDTSNATETNRVKLYVNGEQVTSLSSANYPSLNEEFNGAFNTGTRNVGRFNVNAPTIYYGDMYLADVYWIDGQALTPSDFGDYDGNNYWVPKAYTGTYGTNGFYLDFSDTTSTATLVADQSGAGNNWTPNNISLTAGTTYDSMVDSPTPYADAGNYAVLNPLNKSANATLSDGNTKAVASTTTCVVASTIAVNSGKWYWEHTTGTAYDMVGVVSPSSPVGTMTAPGYSSDSYGYLMTTGNKYNNSSASAYGATFSSGDVIGVALDLDAGTLTYYKNNVSQGVAFSSLSGYFIPAMRPTTNAAGSIANFGQRPFAYTPPTGFKTLNSFNIPEVTTDLETPNLVWIKSRSASQSHTLFDSVRGVHNYLESDDTAIEATDVNSLLQFNKNGFLLGASATVNTSGRTYVGWGWKAGTAFSNDAGTNGATIASVGSVNQDAGFSIVTFTSTGSVETVTVGHGLGDAPAMVITKERSAVGSWGVYHKGLPSPASQFLNLHTTGAAVTNTSYWGNTNPSSSVVTLGNGTMMALNTTMVMYCFADVEGYSKMGKWQNNNSTDGTFVYLGFRPRFILLKNYDNVESWYIWDSVRQTYNVPPPSNNWLSPRLPNSEAANGASTAVIDGLSNGFKIRTTSSSSGEISFGTRNYIYMAFAENPFKNSLAR